MTSGGWGACPPSPFCVAKRKKGNKGKKKEFQLKGCHQGQTFTILAILERKELKNFLASQPWWSTILFSVP